MKRQRTIIIMLIILFILVEQPVFACSVPVFRYAMERWPADYYEAVLIHRGQLTEDDKQLLDELRQEDSEAEALLNLHILEVDITTTTDEKIKSLLLTSEELPETLPVLVLWYPSARGRTPPIWQGQLTRSTVAALLQSPTRQKLAEHLIEGQTAVWIFVESGKADKDKAALQLLEQELETATRELKEEAESIPDEPGVPEITYSFSILPVSRSDPNERMLLTLLLNSELDLDEYSDKPVMFPVFGRGRALYALIGEGITSDNIRETIAFLVGPCGCEIKMLNPGMDILMAANWDAAAMRFYEEYYETYNEVPELTGVMPEAPAEENLKTEDKEIGNSLEDNVTASMDGPTPVNDVPVNAVEAKERKLLGLGIMGTTGVMLAVILLVVVLGTMAISPRRKGHL
ncbi:MAG TPA: hypothetical protein VMW72_25090 [Sedimentisphaerales bacterium]|nr:hypothetical protein [Sedimentisphaerales bacterium]